MEIKEKYRKQAKSITIHLQPTTFNFEIFVSFSVHLEIQFLQRIELLTAHGKEMFLNERIKPDVHEHARRFVSCKIKKKIRRIVRRIDRLPISRRIKQVAQDL